MENNELIEFLNGKFEKIDGKFEKIDGKFEKIDGKFEKINKDLEKNDQKFDNFSKELINIKENVSAIKEDMVTKEDFSNLQTSVDGYVKRVDDYFQDETMLSHKVNRHESRLLKIAEKVGIKLEY